MDILCVEAAGVGIAFRRFIEKARTFIPKSSYFHICFFDVSGLGFRCSVVFCGHSMGVLGIFYGYSM